MCGEWGTLMKYDFVLEDLTGKRKRGRKLGGNNLCCTIPYCHVCGDRICAENMYGVWKSGKQKGKPVSLCKECAPGYQQLKVYRKKNIVEIKERISWHIGQIEILKQVWREKEGH